MKVWEGEGDARQVNLIKRWARGSKVCACLPIPISHLAHCPSYTTPPLP